MSIRERVLATEAWNHPTRALIVLVAIAAFAGGFSAFVRVWLPGPWTVEVLGSALFVTASMLLAATVLAAFD